MSYDFAPEDSPDRHAFVAQQLKRLTPPPKPEAKKPGPKTEEAFPGDFLVIEGSWPVSKDLAKQFRYKVGDDRDARDD